MSFAFRQKRLGYLFLNVTDLERSTRFATEVFGLDLVAEREDGSRCFRAGIFHQDIIMAQAREPALARSSWELESEAELDIAYSHFAERKLNPAWVSEAECSTLKLERAFRVVDPVLGKTWEYFSHMTWMPAARKNPITKFQGGKHFGLLVQDSRKTSEYLIRDHGFLSSDFFEGHEVIFLRAWPNPNHHSIAMVQTAGPLTRMHHVAFMVDEIDDIGRLFNRARRLRADVQFGIGRHPTSGSMHLYIYDPDNFVWEYTLGMEQFPETGAREARRVSSAPDDFDLWGAVPDGTRQLVLPVVATVKTELR